MLNLKIVLAPDDVPGDKSRRLSPVPDAYHAHCAGVVSLLRMRGQSQFATEKGQRLFWNMYIFIVSALSALKTP